MRSPPSSSRSPRVASADPFFLDRADRHYLNQKWLNNDFGDRLPSEVFRDRVLACYVTDKTAIKNRHDVGMNNIAWECDYPHSDCFWPDAPEKVLAEFNAAGATDAEIDQITWENSAKFFNWDPFTLKTRTSPGGRPACTGHRRRHHRPAARGSGRRCTRPRKGRIGPRDRRGEGLTADG